MIEVKQLLKTYTVGEETISAVDHVNLTVARGDNIAIIGHSGSGKSTLLSLIGGLAAPDSGSVAIGGTVLSSISDQELSKLRNQKISFIYQFASLIPSLTSLENILLPTAFGKSSSSHEAYARELLAMVKLTDKGKAYPSQLSGGQQRRIAIARAFINYPEIILADEPTGDLDEDTESEIIELFQQMNKEQNITFVVVTHSSEVASQIGKQYRMTNGVLTEHQNSV